MRERPNQRATIPSLSGVDHVHVYVPDRDAAAQWYGEVLGFTPLREFQSWANDPRGPLTLADACGMVHLALFERRPHTPGTAIALGAATAAEFLQWKSYLQAQDILERCSDHDLAFSLYFRDPWQNMHEITTYDHASVREAMQAQ